MANRYVWNEKMPEWGYGLVRTVSGKKLDILFENGGRRLLRRDFAALEDVDPANIAEDSPLHDRKQWRRLESQKAFRAEFGRMLSRFQEIFPGGFADEEYASVERDYKLKAVTFAQEHFTAEALAALREEGGATAVFEKILESVSLTNLVHPRWERARIAAIPEDQHEAFVDAFVELIHGEDEYGRRLTAFAKLLSDYGAGKWTIATYFGFIYKPAEHPFVKPDSVRYAAKALKQELHYTAQPNTRTWRAIEQLYADVRRRLAEQGYEPADTIDIQYFLWVGGPGYEQAREWRAGQVTAEDSPAEAPPKPIKKPKKAPASRALKAIKKPAPPAAPVQKPWVEAELREAVEAYFWMQAQEKQSRTFDRAAVYTDLGASPLKGHSQQEIRRCMLHISAALVEVNRPHLGWMAPPSSPDAELLAAVIPVVRTRLTEARKLFAPTADPVQLIENSHTIAQRGLLRRPSGRRNPDKTQQSSTVWMRDPQVRAWVIRRAGGHCELCREKARYIDAQGTFFKLFNLRPLSEGGADTVENTAALCPNCYQELLYTTTRPVYVQTLRNNVSELE